MRVLLLYAQAWKALKATDRAGVAPVKIYGNRQA